MSGNAVQRYVIPGAETAIGVGSEIVAPGNPIGLGLAGSGIGQLAGGAAGGNKGQALGGALGGVAGGLGGGLGGNAGMGSLLGGNPLSGALGSLLGGMGGAGSAAGAGSSGFAMPGMSGTPSMAGMSGALPSWLDPSQVAGVSVDQSPLQSAASSIASLGSGSGGSNPFSSGLGSIGQSYLNYVLQSKLNKQSYAPPRAPAFSSSGSGPMAGNLAIAQGPGIQLPRIG